MGDISGSACSSAIESEGVGELGFFDREDVEVDVEVTSVQLQNLIFDRK
jgi:hypothetical protein